MPVKCDERETYPLDNISVTCMDRDDRQRIIRLILEGLEVSLHLCNAYLYTFGPMRLIDVLEQILPTAYVINTSYWPMYRTDSGHCICICNMFGTICPHTSSEENWLRLNRPVNESVFFKNGSGEITLRDIVIAIEKFPEKKLYLDSKRFAPYKVKNIFEIRLKFRGKCSWRYRDHEYFDPVKFRLRFKFIKQKMNFNKFCLWLVPHPVLMYMYGEYFSSLLKNLDSSAYPGCLLVSWLNCPKHTIVITNNIFFKYLETIVQKVDKRQRA